MAGTKRTWDGKQLSLQPNNNEHQTTTMAEQSTQILSIFETFRNELDEHHDRRERLIKISRDITALSKKIIRKLNAPLPENITKETQSRFTQIQSLFTNALPDVTGPNKWRYQRQLSGAIQEYIEALSFHHYLTTQTLITLPEVCTKLPAEILVTEEDYLLGLFDLTGEMMRFAVTALSAGSVASDEKKMGLSREQNGIVVDLREMRSLFEGLSVSRRHNLIKDLGKKMDVMQGSVEKVERAAYGILVRGSERPAGWMPDLSGGGDEGY
ncbi:Translin family-domain-containing protein [Aspergillus pseudonomiae]|uniref:Translin family-domain-containing protein n=1 Tax=Aspergillus pseudonomiae TaxID=1506151 RepID=A0A5N7CUN9_9EURO|nr:Translin family-domain-containing protein [Aspergillus pseudonomiae]KAB8254469.1 Translin family-domain-containing protein [Aspergillus pseudonomiae]KAE8397841.1 Translin family-domain-containing protein [Aspergillus pseudonomiae]